MISPEYLLRCSFCSEWLFVSRGEICELTMIITHIRLLVHFPRMLLPLDDDRGLLIHKPVVFLHNPPNG